MKILQSIAAVGLAVILTLYVIMLASMFCGCMTSPDRTDYSCDECYMAADCLYRIKSSDEKSPCAFLTEACRDALKERARIYRLEYCRDKRPPDMTERECRSWLNEK